jgi:hypothetical protein
MVVLFLFAQNVRRYDLNILVASVSYPRHHILLVYPSVSSDHLIFNIFVSDIETMRIRLKIVVSLFPHDFPSV